MMSYTALYPANQVLCPVSSQGRVVKEKLELQGFSSERDSVSLAESPLPLGLSHW